MQKKKIYNELVEIRKELQEIRELLSSIAQEDPEGDSLIEDLTKNIIGEFLYETVAQEYERDIMRNGTARW